MREYIYLPEAEIAPTATSRTPVDRPVAVVEAVNTASPVLWHVHVDHLHRPIRMTNAAKASVWDAQWLPWGGVHAITGNAVMDARFPGQWFQAETGLHYNWHRSYDASIGRYTQPDPLGFVDGPSVYGYARGQPQSGVDPTGEYLVQSGRIIIGTGAVAMAACMKLPACRNAVEKFKDQCAKIRCNFKRERPDHKFSSQSSRFCEHYRVTCWIEGRGQIFEAQIPLPGLCHDRPQKDVNTPPSGG